MADRALCAAAAASLAAVPKERRPKVTVGFDGFIDNIIDVVAKRADATSYQAMGTITELGNRIGAAAGNSAINSGLGIINDGRNSSPGGQQGGFSGGARGLSAR